MMSSAGRAHQLHRAARAARRAAPQHHRRLFTDAIGLDRRRRAPTSSSAWTATSPSFRTCTSAATSRSRGRPAREGRRPQLSHRSSTTRPTGTACSSIGSSCAQNFNPEVGFLPRSGLPTSNFASARFSPRPARSATDPQVLLSRAVYQLYDRQRQPPRVAQAHRRVPRSSCRTATRSRSSIRGTTSSCDGRSRSRATRAHPGRRLRLQPACAMAYSPGQQHRLSGTGRDRSRRATTTATRKTASLPGAASASRRSSASSRTSR